MDSSFILEKMRKTTISEAEYMNIKSRGMKSGKMGRGWWVVGIWKISKTTLTFIHF